MGIKDIKKLKWECIILVEIGRNGNGNRSVGCVKMGMQNATSAHIEYDTNMSSF